jgi:hypothetical protein
VKKKNVGGSEKEKCQPTDEKIEKEKKKSVPRQMASFQRNDHRKERAPP